MRIVDFVREDMVLPKLHARDKGGVLRELSHALAAGVPGLDPEAVDRVLNDRERQASTAVGEGVAIPHGKLGQIEELVACVARSPEGVDFASVDGRPTHLFFVLVAPENSTGAHLKALARISRLFKDQAFRERLLGAQGAAEMYRLIREEDEKH